jgi:large subunit ribosomal protein L18
MILLKKKKLAWWHRKNRIRKKVFGTSVRPRLSVFRSLNHIYVQVIDDTKGMTLAAASTISPELKEEKRQIKDKLSAAQLVGELIAKRATSLGIKKVVFDRNGFPYHGRIKALADRAREGGLEF